MRTIAIGDVHGCYKELKGLMDYLIDSGEYNAETDTLVFLGDYIDRGEDSMMVVDYIRNLQKNNKHVIALKGNHEDMICDYYNQISDWWLFNGYEFTKASYRGHEEKMFDDIEWMEKLPLYYEDEHCIFVHAGINPSLPMEKQDAYTMLWTREEFLDNPKKTEKLVIFGHTPNLNFPYYTMNDNICIDTGCVFGGALTAVIIDDGIIKKFCQNKKGE